MRTDEEKEMVLVITLNNNQEFNIIDKDVSELLQLLNAKDRGSNSKFLKIEAQTPGLEFANTFINTMFILHIREAGRKTLLPNAKLWKVT